MDEFSSSLEAFVAGVVAACAALLIPFLFTWNSLFFPCLAVMALPLCLTGAFSGNYVLGGRAGIWFGAVTGFALTLLLSLVSYIFLWLGTGGD